MAAERGKPKTKAQHKKLAGLLSEPGTKVSEALIAAGYSKTQANKGWESVPKSVIKLLPKKTRMLMDRGKALAAEKRDMEHLIIGRLADNVTAGKDGGSLSAKILGSHRDLNLWQPEGLAGVIVLNAPKSLLENKHILDLED